MLRARTHQLNVTEYLTHASRSNTFQHQHRYTEFLHTVRRLTPLTDKQCEVLLYLVDENEDGLIDYEEVEKFVFSDEYPEILKRKRERKKTTPSRGEEKMSRSDQLLKELASLQSERSRLESENKSQRAKILRNKKTSQQKTNRNSARRIPRETWQHRTRSPDKVAHAEKPPKSSRVSTRLLEDELIAAERDLHRTTKNLKGVSLSLSEKRMAIVEKSKELRVTNQQSELLLQIVRRICLSCYRKKDGTQIIKVTRALVVIIQTLEHRYVKSLVTLR